MDKKELVLSDTDDVQTIFCDDAIVTEYDVTLTLTSKKHTHVIVWVINASKKLTFTLQADVTHTSAEITIFIKAQQTAHHRVHVFQNHTADNTTSTCTIKGIAYDTSTIEYQGLITLESGSFNAHAEQKSTFLLMSDTATIRSIPSLQVLHNDVQCSHSTTISYLDPLIIWYSQQRGLSIIQAEELVEKVFFL